MSALNQPMSCQLLLHTAPSGQTAIVSYPPPLPKVLQQLLALAAALAAEAGNGCCTARSIALLQLGQGVQVVSRHVQHLHRQQQVQWARITR